ncbi:kinase-like domain-containing protein [Entophlyctis helioformis]|nr:kinase-like domain-containing protein [Entophlyctis helioformis]
MEAATPVAIPATPSPLTGRKRLGPAPPIDLFKKTASVGSLADVSLPASSDGDSQAQPQSQAIKRINAESVAKDSKLKFRAADLETISVLGSGSGGTVSKVLHTPTKKLMARKVCPTEQERLEKMIMRELRILRLCRSPRVVTFYGAFLEEGDINIMMEFMDIGTLESVYRKVKPIPEQIVTQITLHILEGLIYLYDNHKIVHRDIKPSNILINSNGEVKIADFGVSKEISNGTQAATFTGTQGYLAPERVRDGTACTAASDVWSLGLTVMEVALGSFPIPPEAMATIFDLLQYIEEEPAPSLPADKFSEEFCEFTSLCLVKDPQKRMHPQQLLVRWPCITRDAHKQALTDL